LKATDIKQQGVNFEFVRNQRSRKEGENGVFAHRTTAPGWCTRDEESLVLGWGTIFPSSKVPEVGAGTKGRNQKWKGYPKGDSNRINGLPGRTRYIRVAVHRHECIGGTGRLWEKHEGKEVCVLKTSTQND